MDEVKNANLMIIIPVFYISIVTSTCTFQYLQIQTGISVWTSYSTCLYQIAFLKEKNYLGSLKSMEHIPNWIFERKVSKKHGTSSYYSSWYMQTLQKILVKEKYLENNA